MRISDWSSDVCSSDLNQLPDFLIAGVLGNRNILCRGLGQNTLAIEPRAIVGNLDNDLAAIVLRRKRQLAFGILAVRRPHVRRLDAMVETVAHQMSQRVDNALDQALVEFGGLARSEERRGGKEGVCTFRFRGWPQ